MASATLRQLVRVTVYFRLREGRMSRTGNQRELRHRGEIEKQREDKLTRYRKRQQTYRNKHEAHIIYRCAKRLYAVPL